MTSHGSLRTSPRTDTFSGAQFGFSCLNACGEISHSRFQVAMRSVSATATSGEAAVAASAHAISMSAARLNPRSLPADGLVTRGRHRALAGVLECERAALAVFVLAASAGRCRLRRVADRDVVDLTILD